jgi:hypothetical protein
MQLRQYYLNHDMCLDSRPRHLRENLCVGAPKGKNRKAMLELDVDVSTLCVKQLLKIVRPAMARSPRMCDQTRNIRKTSRALTHTTHSILKGPN